MGKKLRQRVTCSPIQNHPGFMWGLFDILKHNHWRYIKKRLPHKRPHLAGGCRRNASAGTKTEVNKTTQSQDGIPVSNSKVEDKTNVDSGKRPKKPSSSAVKSKEESNSGEQPKKQHSSEEKSKNLNPEEKRRRTHSEIKRSVKSLIKALVIEDKSKRKKGRHHRSSTYPVQSNPKEKESLSEVGEVESSDKDSSNNKIAISPSIGSLNPLYLMSEESSFSDSEDFKLENTTPVDDTDSKQKEEAGFNPKLNEDDTSSPTQSKACLDALNLIHMNRNFLLKVLQDPGSPLARHFQREQAFSSKTMTRAGSFPTHHGSNRENHGNVPPTSSPYIQVENRVDVTNEKSMEKLDDEEDSSGYTRKRGKNHQVVIKRFKDLRQKIKHVINENKSEKHRITMDAVLDKVPRKYGFSKDLRQDIFSHCSSTKKEGAKPRQIRRTSSLCGSVDRYLQLYEKSFQKNNATSENSKVEEPALSCKIVPKFLGRILSLPETKSPYALKTEDLPSQFETSSRSMEQEQNGMDEISEHQSSEHEMPETTDDPSSNETEQDRETSTVDVEPDEHQSLYESSGDYPTSDENASESHIPRDPSFADLEVQQDPDTETCETSKQLESITAADIDEYLQIEAQDKVKFNYVRDILEISGFNAPESLSMWQSDYQPLDPLVYQEMTTTATTRCMIQDPECSRNEEEEEEQEEEGGNYNHLLLFDLINEVLIEIYERSYHYCPKPLSSLCRIHPMPVGYSVLKDVWVRINCYLSYKPHDEQSFDEIMSRDLRRDDGWMGLQFESECVGIEVEDLIFEELLEELLDEIFHVPQAQQYCNGNLRSWDPMITTPPGLNVVDGNYFSVLLTSLFYILGANLSDRKAALMALVMTLYPLHWFFTFLYYTDVASLTAFLAMYLACLRKRYILSALVSHLKQFVVVTSTFANLLMFFLPLQFGAFAIFIRQTNIVWMLFVACSGVLDFTLDSPRQKQKEKVDQDSDHQSIDGKEATLRSNLRKRKPDSILNRFDLGKSIASTEDTSGLLYDVYTVISTSWSMKWKVLVTFSPFIVVVVAFGAKEAHVVSPHFAQIMYFSLVSALFTAPLHFSVAQLRTMLQELRRNWPLSLLLTLLALLAGLASVHFFRFSFLIPLSKQLGSSLSSS
ncbi:hypothetical protein Bca52824_095669 [Brassica carinata]|uniref:Dol-P-Glc:Glc(2)Man(9)GlcNAc(2)-PP-Dol alpha-1,2-glucosyltransferase n=1 Tax=Brassica carinata TaxID=52824 RepID=A0A8X7NZU4_BRACI|nr:hypothetical protein Bca52824_095669 [Brassica carinata]